MTSRPDLLPPLAASSSSCAPAALLCGHPLQLSMTQPAAVADWTAALLFVVQSQQSHRLPLSLRPCQLPLAAARCLPAAASCRLPAALHWRHAGVWQLPSLLQGWAQVSAVQPLLAALTPSAGLPPAMSLTA